MKKILIGLFIIFISFPIFSQNWERNSNFEQILEDWDVYLEVWMLEENDQLIISFEDYWSENWFDIREQMTGLLYVLDNYNVSITPDMVYFVTYSWIENEENTWDIFINEEWLNKYASTTRSSERRSMINKIVDTQELQWEEKNNLYMVPNLDSTQIQDIQEQKTIEQNIGPELKLKK